MFSGSKAATTAATTGEDVAVALVVVDVASTTVALVLEAVPSATAFSKGGPQYFSSTSKIPLMTINGKIFRPLSKSHSTQSQKEKKKRTRLDMLCEVRQETELKWSGWKKILKKEKKIIFFCYKRYCVQYRHMPTIPMRRRWM